MRFNIIKYSISKLYILVSSISNIKK